MTNKTKAAIEEAADTNATGHDHKCAYARHQGFTAGAQHVIEHPERYGLASIDAYKECFEQFIPEDKWDEATAFLSSHGNGVAKDFQRKENYG